jgi:hypothetical protein
MGDVRVTIALLFLGVTTLSVALVSYRKKSYEPLFLFMLGVVVGLAATIVLKGFT